MFDKPVGVVVGEGVSSYVYTYGESCVIKISKPDMQNALKNEARLHAIVQKYQGIDNYVPMLDHGEDRDTYWLEFPRLQPLPKRLSEQQTLVVATRICTALASMHRHRISHCDVKQDNMMYNGTDLESCSLTDFGLMQAHIYTTNIQSAIYRPEDVAALTTTSVPWRQACASDCFALGCTLHQMATDKVARQPCDVCIKDKTLAYIISGFLVKSWKHRLSCVDALACLQSGHVGKCTFIKSA